MARINRLTASAGLGTLTADLKRQITAHVEKDPQARRDISKAMNQQVKAKLQPAAQGFVTGLMKGLADAHTKGFPNQTSHGNRVINMTLPEVHGDGSIGSQRHSVRIPMSGLALTASNDSRIPYWKWKRRAFLHGRQVEGRSVVDGGQRLRRLTGQSAAGVRSLVGTEKVHFGGRATQGTVIRRGSRRYISVPRTLSFSVSGDDQWNDLLIQSLLSGTPATIDVSHRELPRGRPLSRALHQEKDRPMAGPASSEVGRMMIRQLKRLRF